MSGEWGAGRRLVLNGSEACLEDVQAGFGRRAIDVQCRQHEQHAGSVSTRAWNATSVSEGHAAVARQLRVPALLVPPSVWRDFARDINYS
jgi:hypothetical protein